MLGRWAFYTNLFHIDFTANKVFCFVPALPVHRVETSILIRKSVVWGAYMGSA